MNTNSFRRSALPLLFALAAFAATLPAAADPEPWLLGDDDDRIAVIAVNPGDEALYAAGPLQECAAMDLPALVFCTAANATLSSRASAAANAFTLPPDSVDLLADPFAQLPSLLPAFDPSHVILTRPDPAYLSLLADIFPDPATRPAVLLPATDPDTADWQMLLPPYQLDAKTAALAAYALPSPASESESFAEFDLDDLPPSPPQRALLPPPAPEPTPSSPVDSSPSPLRPRTRLPSAPKPPKTFSSWADEPLTW